LLLHRIQRPHLILPSIPDIQCQVMLVKYDS
jgi:hypothetical protein